jgi:hypothetical protein
MVDERLTLATMRKLSELVWDAHELDHPVEEPWWTRQRTPGG